MLGWVLFRADSIGYALEFIENMFLYKAAIPNFAVLNYVNAKVAFVLIFGVAFSGVVQTCLAGTIEKWKRTVLFETIKSVFLVAILLGSLMSIASGAYSPFIYFKF